MLMLKSAWRMIGFRCLRFTIDLMDNLFLDEMVGGVNGACRWEDEHLAGGN